MLLASVYSDFEMPFEFELDKKGRKTDVPIPNDLSSPRFVVKMLLTVVYCASTPRRASRGRRRSRWCSL